MGTRRTLLAAFLAAATLVSCGDKSGESSPTTTRKRNAALTNEAPTITSIESGTDSLTVHVALTGGTAPNTWFYQLSTDTPGAANPIAGGTETVRNAPESFVIANLTNGADYVVRVAHWNGETSDYTVAQATVGVTPPSTTTTIPATTTTTITCRTGGDCAVGDIGPGGGTVFFDAGAAKTWGRYLEFAPVDVAATQFGCLGSTPSASLSAIGDGRANTDEISLGTCGSGTAAKAIASYSLAGVSDWYMPSKSELNELCKFARGQTTGDATVACSPTGTLRTGFTATHYWSSTEAGNDLASIQNFVTGQQINYGKPAPGAVRPIRAFTNANGLTVATTKAPNPCKRGGKCVVGDTGPGGGVVFYVAPTVQAWGQYLEVTTGPIARGTGWGCERNTTVSTAYNFGSGQSNTTTLVGLGCTAAVTADSYVSPTGKDDWFLPSDGELDMALASGKFGDGTTTYWTSSTSASDSMTVFSTLYTFSRARSTSGRDWGNIGRSSGYSSSVATAAIRAFSATAA